MTNARAPLVGVVSPWRAAPPPRDALRLLSNRPHPFLRWGAGGPRDISRWSFAASDPVEILSADVGARGLSLDPWETLSAGWPRRVRRVGPRLPFAGGWVGTWGYEVRSAVESIPAPREAANGFPTLWLGRYQALVAWDRATGRSYLAGTGTSVATARDAMETLRERLRSGDAPAAILPSRAASRGSTVSAAVSPGEYRRRVRGVMERIRAGDLFQANPSQRFDASLADSTAGLAVDLFERLAKASPVPFLTYLDLGEGRRVLSASPERFLSLEGTRAETRPMKGTRPRGVTREEDARLRAELLGSVKDRAELAMIVDLSRNDLGRVCRPGSVRVVRARRLERYATVHQAVGIVEGELLAGKTGVDLVKAAFPPGSVTGAPKVEAMRVIDSLEGEARGPYCGAVGWLDEGGDLDLAVAIRTVWTARDRVTYRVGGGVTLLSEPEAERVETLDKGKALGLAIVGRAGTSRKATRRARPDLEPRVRAAGGSR